MQTIYNLTVEYESEDEKFHLEPNLDKELNGIIEKMKAVNPNNRITIKKDYETGN